MEYPADFETTGFPAGKVLATNRVVAICIMLVIVLITVMCGLLLWAQRSVRVHPFLVSINSVTGQWSIVGHQHGDYKTVDNTSALMESVIADFVKYRFSISADANTNASVWQRCDLAKDCSLAAHQENSIINPDRCGLFCTTDIKVFDAFVTDVMPVYEQYAIAKDVRTIDTSAMRFQHLHGNVYQVQFIINSTLYGDMQILGYAVVERDTTNYPYNLGCDVSNFSAYRVQ